MPFSFPVPVPSCLSYIFLIFTVDRVEHILPQAHLRLPGISPSQLVSYPSRWSHHCTHCTVSLVFQRFKVLCGNLICFLLFLPRCSQFNNFLQTIFSGNIMRTSQTLSVNELARSVGCLGKYLCYVSLCFQWLRKRTEAALSGLLGLQ